MDAELHSHTIADAAFVCGPSSQLVGTYYLRDHTANLSLIATLQSDQAMSTFVKDSAAMIAEWTRQAPEHAKGLTAKFVNPRNVAREGETLMLRKATDSDTGVVWGRVHLHLDGTAEGWKVTEPPPDAKPDIEVKPSAPTEATIAEAFVETIVALEPPADPHSPPKTWGDRKRK